MSFSDISSALIVMFNTNQESTNINNNNNNNNKRQFVRRHNMSVDITRAPYRQSGNVVRDSSTVYTMEMEQKCLNSKCIAIYRSYENNCKIKNCSSSHVYYQPFSELVLISR